MYLFYPQMLAFTALECLLSDKCRKIIRTMQKPPNHRPSPFFDVSFSLVGHRNIGAKEKLLWSKEKFAGGGGWGGRW